MYSSYVNVTNIIVILLNSPRRTFFAENDSTNSYIWGKCVGELMLRDSLLLSL